MSLHQEKHFEQELCDYLAAHGWLYTEGDAANYDREHALYPADIAAWVQETQPEAWQVLIKTHAGQAVWVLAERIRKNLNERGTLDVLRRGVEVLGLKQPLALVQFRPALQLNADILKKYEANRLRVARQVRHSVNNTQDALDLVLFLNGIPVATAELKSEFTQSVQDAVDQYRFDRHPFPKGGQAEPLLSFPGSHGSVIYLRSYLSTMFDVADVMIDKEEIAMALSIPVSASDDTAKEDSGIPDEWICVSESQNCVPKSHMKTAMSKAAKVLATAGVSCCECPHSRYKLLPLSESRENISNGFSLLEPDKRAKYLLEIYCRAEKRIFAFEFTLLPLGNLKKEALS